MTEKTKLTAEELARKIAAENPDRRFAVSSTGSGIAVFDPEKEKFTPIIERTITGHFVACGINSPGREWVELPTDSGYYPPARMDTKAELDAALSGEKTIWNSDGTDGPCLICAPPQKEAA